MPVKKTFLKGRAISPAVREQSRPPAIKDLGLRLNDVFFGFELKDLNNIDTANISPPMKPPPGSLCPLKRIIKEIITWIGKMILTAALKILESILPLFDF